MFCWRITKYDPEYRDNNGIYSNIEWTSYSDIGKVFKGIPLTFDDYMKWESRYLAAINIVTNAHNVKFLEVDNLEKYPFVNHPNLSVAEMKFYTSLENHMSVPINNIDMLARLILREIVWCKLSNTHMYLHFGYDYYMYIGSVSPLKDELEHIKTSGLFVESMISPYCSSEEEAFYKFYEFRDQFEGGSE